MKQVIHFAVLVYLFIFLAGPVFAQDPIIYPAEGQSQDQMERDEFECFRWARDQTGFDPMKTPTATSPPPQKQARRGGAGRGAVGGAVVDTHRTAGSAAAQHRDLNGTRDLDSGVAAGG